MNIYKVDIRNGVTGELTEQLEITKPYITNNDFKLIVSAMFLHAAVNYLNSDLTAFIFRNGVPFFSVGCKTHVNGSTITTDFSVDDSYIYSKTIAC